MCVTKLAWRGHDVVATIFGVQKMFRLRVQRFLIGMFVSFYGDHVHRFVSLLNWGPHTA